MSTSFFRTLHLTVSYFDRYLLMNAVNRKKLQLLGVSCMLIIAAKYEEISPPSVSDFCYITDNMYENDGIVKMEAAVLKSLNFELGNPTAKTLLRWFTRIVQEKFNVMALDDFKHDFSLLRYKKRSFYDSQCISCFQTSNSQLDSLGHFLADLSLLDYSCVKFPSSLVAASVIFLSIFSMWPSLHPWNLKLQECSGHTPSNLRQCVLIIHDLQRSRRG